MTEQENREWLKAIALQFAIVVAALSYFFFCVSVWQAGAFQ